MPQLNSTNLCGTETNILIKYFSVSQNFDNSILEISLNKFRVSWLNNIKTLYTILIMILGKANSKLYKFFHMPSAFLSCLLLEIYLGGFFCRFRFSYFNQGVVHTAVDKAQYFYIRGRHDIPIHNLFLTILYVVIIQKRCEKTLKGSQVLRHFRSWCKLNCVLKLETLVAYRNAFHWEYTEELPDKNVDKRPGRERRWGQLLLSRSIASLIHF